MLRRKHIVILIAFLIIILFFLIPVIRFDENYSTVVYSENGDLLAAKIADDEQWRFPLNDSIPEKLKTAIFHFEDEYFYVHPGVNPLSLLRAIRQNIAAGKIVSGGSTITMQVARLSRGNKARTFWQKFIETLLSFRLEVAKSKKEILTMYAAHAPFGGNVVGIEAASWRYFGRNPSQLSWAESATLAVLPNAPGLIFPGRKKAELKRKRNFLLDKLYKKGKIDSLSCALSKEEPLPKAPRTLPQTTPHLLDYFVKTKKGERIFTTINTENQENTASIVQRHIEKLKHQQIHNAAVLVLDTKTGNVLAYVGNSKSKKDEHGEAVDIIRSPRSTGSLLKPFLYAALLDEGKLLPDMLVEDIPTQLGSYTPKNYSATYDGAVPASKALARSLNVPAVKMLLMYGVPKFQHKICQLGATTINKEAAHYGTSIILGGAEVTLWDICGMYASLGRNLWVYDISKHNYSKKVLHPPNLLMSKSIDFSKKEDAEKESFLSASAIWFTLKALQEVNRPAVQSGCENFASAEKISWKTGTSFGLRDAWAVGTNMEYVAGVWVGNADGEGRPGLVGTQVAAPILFDVFRSLNSPQNSFPIPYDELVYAEICTQSGHLASQICDKKEKRLIPQSGRRSYPCPYHQWVHLNKSNFFRVNTYCESIDKMVKKAWFVLPTVQEWYYKKINPSYQKLPPLRNDCAENEVVKMLDLVYPQPKAQIYIPFGLDGKRGSVVFEAVHRSGKIIYWHLDEMYLGYTQHFHQMEILATEGIHRLTLVDEDGERLVRNFELLEKTE